jgi:hypothetical protein
MHSVRLFIQHHLAETHLGQRRHPIASLSCRLLLEINVAALANTSPAPLPPYQSRCRPDTHIWAPPHRSPITGDIHLLWPLVERDLEALNPRPHDLGSPMAESPSLIAFALAHSIYHRRPWPSIIRLTRSIQLFTLQKFGCTVPKTVIVACRIYIVDLYICRLIVILSNYGWLLKTCLLSWARCSLKDCNLFT